MEVLYSLGVSLLQISFTQLIYALVLLAFLAILTVIVTVWMTTLDAVPNIVRYESEKYFVDPNKEDLKRSFPYLEEEGCIDFSLVVPSYNEEERLPVMLEETFAFLDKRKENNPSFTYEVIIVDDGSRDKTTEVALGFAKQRGTDLVRVLTLAKNRGKGGAVRLGMFSSRGKQILMVDADGATKFADIVNVEKALDEITDGQAGSYGISCGSRAHLQEKAVAERTFLRNLLMHCFHFLVSGLCVQGIRDTQCGFKMFTRKAALATFSTLHVERWAFDVELLYIAQRLKIPIAEVAVNWVEIEGSKMIPFWSWLQMGKDLVLIRLRHQLGVWKVQPMKLKAN